MSHGGPKGSNDSQWGIVCRDEITIDIEKDVITVLSNREAKNLTGIPRFIVINACRFIDLIYFMFIYVLLYMFGIYVLCLKYFVVMYF